MKKVESKLLTVHRQALLRTPQFSVDAEFLDCWEDLKISISHASAQFYALIKDLDYEQLQQAPDHIQYTVWKYFNRAKYRATPFGSFAGIGLVNFISSSNAPITTASTAHLHCFHNWPQDSEIDPFGGDLKQIQFFTNSSYYVLQNSIRYLSHFNDDYQLSEVESNRLILTILELCSAPISYPTLLDALNKDIAKDSVPELLKELVEVQLLLTSGQRNIIGEDYFKRTKITTDASQPKYIISERQVTRGGLPPSLFRHLPELVNRLNSVLKPTEAPAFSTFISRFRQKFGEEYVPLMQALDPEVGVGYDHLEQLDHDKDLLFSSLKMDNPLPDDFTRLKDHLLQLSNGHWPPVIKLEDFIIGHQNKAATLPNSLTVLGSITDDAIHIESIGGCTANAVLGRFSICGQNFRNLCKEIATIEQDANPGVLFFDIGYTGEAGIENINRRASIYDIQLNLLNYDTSAAPLTLNDLNISVRGNELVLYSCKLKKRLIPRMASAYNYSRADLSVFRLLCDLQHQGLQTDLHLDLRGWFPNLSYYPRIMFRNIILSPALWKIDIKEVLSEGVVATEGICAYLKKVGASRLFKVGNTDQTLCFDQEKKEDIQAFTRYFKKEKQFYIKEGWPTSAVRDASGRCYHHQLVLCMTHDQKLYDNIEMDLDTQNRLQIPMYFPPGSKWFYFRIYCHPSRTDELLLNVIKPLLTEFQTIIQKWFFIRFEENGHHIRLRICLTNLDFGMQLTLRLSALLDPYLESKTVSDFSLGTYKREIQRYGIAHIDAVEHHFNTDSELVFSLLHTTLRPEEKYRLCERIFYTVKSSCLFVPEEFNELIQASNDAFIAEFKVTPTSFKQLNHIYQKFQQTDFPLLNVQQNQKIVLHIHSLLDTLKSCKPERRNNLFSDLLHMHVNRLFSDHQRHHELLIYYLFSRVLKKEMAQASKAAKKQAN